MYDGCIFYNLNCVTRLVNELWDERFKPLGLSPAHGYMLGLVLKRPGITARELAGELELAASTVSRFVDALEQQRLVERRPHPSDSRASTIHATRAGRALAADLEATGKALYREVRERLGEHEVHDLVERLQVVRARARRPKQTAQGKPP